MATVRCLSRSSSRHCHDRFSDSRDVSLDVSSQRQRYVLQLCSDQSARWPVLRLDGLAKSVSAGNTVLDFFVKPAPESLVLRFTLLNRWEFITHQQRHVWKPRPYQPARCPVYGLASLANTVGAASEKKKAAFCTVRLGEEVYHEIHSHVA